MKYSRWGGRGVNSQSEKNKNIPIKSKVSIENIKIVAMVVYVNMIVVYFIIMKEREWNVVNGGRIDRQSNKNKNIVMESKVLLMIFQVPDRKR